MHRVKLLQFQQLPRPEPRRLDRCGLGTACVSTFEPVNTSGRIDQLLLAGKERVAVGTNFDVQVFLHRRTRLERMAAGTNNVYFLIVRMNFWFHNLTSFAVDKRCAI